MKTLVSLFISLFLLISVCKSQESNYSFKENYELSLSANLTVSSGDGNIDIISSDGSELDVFYIIIKDNKILPYSKEDLEKEKISIKTVFDKDKLRISVHYLGNSRLDSSDKIYVNFKILVPKEINCNITTSDGNISIQGLVSNLKCITDDGSVEIHDVTGNTSVKASDGNINLAKITGSVSAVVSDAVVRVGDIKGSLYIDGSDEDMYINNIDGKVHCISTDGNIRLKNITGDIKAKTSDGKVLFEDISGSLDAVSKDGNIKGNILELRKPLMIETGGGNVDISISGSPGLCLKLKGKRVNVPTINFKGSQNDYFLKGDVNGGGINVDILAISGKINLSYN